MSVVFFDTCVLISCLGKKGDETERAISHMHNAGFALATSISVVGEMIQIAILKGLDFNRLVSIISRYEIEIIFPLNEFRSWFEEVETSLARNGIYGSSSTDRLHIAFALMINADVIVTSAGEARSLHRPRGAATWPRVTDLTRLRAEMG
jgi:predicted nucleic acid-binding protein